MRSPENEQVEIFDHQPERAIIQGIKQLEQADVLIGHNIINYDIPYTRAVQISNQEVRLSTRLFLVAFSIPILLIVITNVAPLACHSDCMDAIPSKRGVTG